MSLDAATVDTLAKWITAITKLKFPDNSNVTDPVPAFLRELKDGTKLCAVLAKVTGRTVDHNKSPKNEFAQKENIGFFTKGCVDVVDKELIPKHTDLYNLLNTFKAENETHVAQGLQLVGLFVALAKHAKTRKLWKGPDLELSNVPIPTKPSSDETVQKKDNTHYAQVHHQMGLSLYATKNYTEALESFSKAISIDPTRSESHNEKGVVLYNMEHYEEALKCFTEAFQLNNSFTTAIYNKGNCYKSMKLYGRALECYDKAIYLDTKYVSAYDQKGVTLAKMERYEEAISEFDKALKLEPNNSTIKTNRENAVKSLLNSEIPTNTVVVPQPTRYRTPARVRIALIIGNGDYESELSSVTHDVKLIAQSLATNGYKTIIVQNTQTLGDLEKAIDNFCNELFDIADDLQSCVFYYIGHGIRSQEINYLIPTKVLLTSETDIRKKCLSLNFTLEKISEYSSNKSVLLMFIDASREGYDTSSWRSSTSKTGLADTRTPKRGLLLMSAEPGKIAQDTCLESGRNSPFAHAICNAMQRGCDISTFAKSVVMEVSRMTHYTQNPQLSGSFSEDFVL